jgi:hypothetical protein
LRLKSMIASSDRIASASAFRYFVGNSCRGQQLTDDSCRVIAGIPDECGSATSVEAERASNPRLCIGAAEVR